MQRNFGIIDIRRGSFLCAQFVKLQLARGLGSHDIKLGSNRIDTPALLCVWLRPTSSGCISNTGCYIPVVVATF
jgi:hypothetical protein